MTQRNIAILTALLSFSAVLSQPCFAADETPPPANFVLLQEDFLKQREFMIMDLGRKIKLMQEARVCAKKSSSPVAFQACNKILVDGIRVQKADPKKTN